MPSSKSNRPNLTIVERREDERQGPEIAKKRNLFMALAGIRERCELFLSPTRLEQKQVEGFGSMRELIEHILERPVKFVNHATLTELADKLQLT